MRTTGMMSSAKSSSAKSMAPSWLKIFTHLTPIALSSGSQNSRIALMPTAEAKPAVQWMPMPVSFAGRGYSCNSM